MDNRGSQFCFGNAGVATLIMHAPPPIVLFKLLTDFERNDLIDYFKKLKSIRPGKEGLYWRFGKKVAQAFENNDDLIESGTLSLGGVVEQITKIVKTAKPARFLLSSLQIYVFELRVPKDVWRVSVVLADIPHLYCELVEFDGINYSDAEFEQWVDLGLCDWVEVDLTKSMKPKYCGSRFGFCLNCMLFFSKKSNRAISKFTGTVARVEICASIRTLKKHYDDLMPNSTELLHFPSSNVERRILFSEFEKELRSSIGVESYNELIKIICGGVMFAIKS